jgi:hypothetical protein
MPARPNCRPRKKNPDMNLDDALAIVELVDAHLDSSANAEYRAQPLAQT